MSPKIALSSKITIGLLFVMLAFFTNLKLQQFREQKAILKEKEELLAQRDTLEKKNQEFSDSLSYLTSSGFKERVARQQLNLKKQDEVVYNFIDENFVEASVQNKSTETSNAKKWWDYLTNKNQL